MTRNVPKVLMYHRFSASPDKGKVTAATFRRQIVEIKNRFHVIRLADLIRAVRTQQSLPPYTVALTVDDGYHDFYSIAYPILKELKVPATLFVTTDFIDGLTWLWPDIIAYALVNGTKTPADVCRAFGINVSHTVSREVAWGLLADRCLSVADNERRRLISQLLELSDIPTLPSIMPEEYAHMTWEELREVHANGIDIGGHTRSHPNLAKVGPAMLREEILGCKNRIEQEIGCPVECFCYPNGKPNDYNDTVKSVIASSGYIGAAVGYYDATACNDPFEIRRYSASDNLHQFRKALYGVEYCGALVSTYAGQRKTEAYAPK